MTNCKIYLKRQDNEFKNSFKGFRNINVILIKNIFPLGKWMSKQSKRRDGAYLNL